MKKIVLYIFTPLILFVASCDKGPLDVDEVVKEDISGKPIYEGLLNDELEFSAIPLVEGNSWTYTVTTQGIDMSDASHPSMLPPAIERYQLTVGTDYEQNDFRWFEMDVDRHISLEFFDHTFDNGINSLSNREDGLMQKFNDGHDSFGTDVESSSMFVPYFEGHQGHLQLANSNHTELFVSPGHEITLSNGDHYTDLVQYRYIADLSEYLDIDSHPGANQVSVSYDYYFHGDVGLIAFRYNAEHIISFLSMLPESMEIVDQLPYGSIEIELVEKHLIEL